MTDDEKFVARAIELAGKATGRTFPNPLVGAVIVSGGKVAGEGFHARAGNPHAEIEAIARASQKTKGATLYLNLEPCCHYGKTPPCTEAIVGAGISRVVFGIHDPDVKVRGRGARLLRKDRVEVEAGVLAPEALERNMPYVHWKLTGRPFIALKLALTLDGRIAAAGRRRITGDKSREYVHYLRAVMESIAIGSGTLEADDPELDRRFYDTSMEPPVRMVFDSSLSFPEKHRWLVAGERVLLFCADGADAEKKKRLEHLGAEVYALPAGNGMVDLDRWVDVLAGLGISSVLVEGGGKVASNLLRKGIFDRLILFHAPLFGAAGAPDWYREVEEPSWMAGDGLALVRCERAGDDIVSVYDRSNLSKYGDMLALMGRMGSD